MVYSIVIIISPATGKTPPCVVQTSAHHLVQSPAPTKGARTLFGAHTNQANRAQQPGSRLACKRGKKLIRYIVRVGQVVRNEENLLHARGSGVDFGAASEIRRGEARDSSEGGFPRASRRIPSFARSHSWLCGRRSGCTPPQLLARHLGSY